MFAAFPGWYATMFSALYLALVLLLVALIVRGVSFEFRDKRRRPALAAHLEHGLTTVGSLRRPAAASASALGDLLHGLPIDAQQEFTGNLLDLLQPVQPLRRRHAGRCCALLHGATFLALKVDGDVRRPRAARGPAERSLHGRSPSSSSCSGRRR